jgi:hypothetical protein
MQNEPVHAKPSMKTHIMFRRALTALAFAAVLALTIGSAQGQTNGAPQPKSQSTAPVQAQYDLVIENGVMRMPRRDDPNATEGASLENIVTVLRQKHPEANIAIAPEIRQEVLPDLKIRAANLDEEFEFLRVASGDKFVFKRNFGDIANPPLFTLEPSEKFLQEVAKNDSRQVQVEVFNFSSYFARLRNTEPMDEGKFQSLKDQTIDKTKDIIRETLESFGSHGIMNFQFHPGANLFVVTGSQDEINVARKIINAMIEQPPGDSNLANNQARNDQARNIEFQIQQQAVDLSQLGAENTQLKARLEALEKAASVSKTSPKF